MQSGLKSGKDVFQIWMKEESDLIQSVARSYGESICLQQFLKNAQSLKAGKSQEMLMKLARLYALSSIQRDLAWFLADGVISSGALAAFEAGYDATVSAVASIAMDAIAAFNIREEMIHAPIAEDWVKYNTFNNHGELLHKIKKSKL
jgi:acyl-CoA oxidase